MIDTSNKIQKIYRNMLMSKTGEERFLMGISMFKTARELVLASFPKDISDKQKKKLLLERFYGREKKKIDLFPALSYRGEGVQKRADKILFISLDGIPGRQFYKR